MELGEKFIKKRCLVNLLNHNNEKKMVLPVGIDKIRWFLQTGLVIMKLHHIYFSLSSLPYPQNYLTAPNNNPSAIQDFNGEFKFQSCVINSNN